jgi:hypothetical protein
MAYVDRTPKLPAQHGGCRILSKPSKMMLEWNGRLRRVYSFGLPAVESCPGAQFGENSSCGVCYANPKSSKEWHTGTVSTRRAGTYGNTNVKRAQAARYRWTQDALMTESGQDAWVETMTAATTWATRSMPYFRVHDSGDLFSPAYVRMWIRVCLNLPDVRFWFPTRSWNVDKPGLPLLRRAVLQRTAAALVELAALPNVAVRPSALHVDVPAPVIPGLHAGTGITRDHTPREGVCPAPTTNGMCGSCHACWLDKDSERFYVMH